MTTTRVPDLAGLHLLIAVSRLGSISAAARDREVSQQAASERLRAIEAQTGLTLLRRGSGGSRLTSAGAVVVEWAARLIELSEEIDNAIDGLRDVRSRDLSLWASMSIADSLVPRWLVELRRRQLGSSGGGRAGGSAGSVTSVSLTAANSRHVEDAVREGVAQLGFVEGVDTPAAVRSSVVAEDELVLVAAPGDPLLRPRRGPGRRHALEADDVARLELTNREAGSGSREVVERALGAAGVGLGDSSVEFTTASAVRQAVLAGSAPAFLSRRMVARDLEAGHLVEVATTLDLRRHFRAIWLGSATPPAGPVRDLVAIARRTTG